MAKLPVMDILAARRRIAGLLQERQQVDMRSLYGTCGAIHLREVFGLPQIMMPGITQWQTPAGTFRDNGTSGEGHALCMALSSIHLSGQHRPQRVAPLAPTSAQNLPNWLDQLDWSTTHKDFWGPVTPILASGLVDQNWCHVLLEWLGSRPWCADSDPPWRVISCIYHVASALDAGCLCYPHAPALLDRLLALQWDRAADDAPRTPCTDGDWAWLLLRLRDTCPQVHVDVMEAIRRVSRRRVIQWLSGADEISSADTFFIYCHFWVTAVFQSVCREHYSGPYLRDTLNDPSLYRLIIGDATPDNDIGKD